MKPPHPRELGATRFFARLRTFDLSCPRCGKVHQIRQTNAHATATEAWNPRSGRFTCRGRDGCNKGFVLGILAWDEPRGQKAGAVPEDQVLSPRELAQVRADGDSWWMPEGSQGTGRMDQSNLAVTADRPDVEEDLELVDWPEGREEE